MSLADLSFHFLFGNGKYQYSTAIVNTLEASLLKKLVRIMVEMVDQLIGGFW